MGAGYPGELLKVSIALTEEETKIAMEALSRYYESDKCSVEEASIVVDIYGMLLKRLAHAKENQKLTERLPRINK